MDGALDSDLQCPSFEEPPAGSDEPGDDGPIVEDLPPVQVPELREEDLADLDEALPEEAGPAPVEEIPLDSEDEEEEAAREPSASVSDEDPAIKRRRYMSEDITSPGWSKHRKHVFILSSAGKPIYSRYGDENSLSGFVGVCQAMVSFVNNQQDSLQHLVAGDHIFVFLVKGPLYYVCVTKTGEPRMHVSLLLEYMHLVIVSILTQPYITKLFKQKPHFDLRRMLGGTENLLDSLIANCDTDPSFILGAAHCLRLGAGVRSTIGTVLQSVKQEELVYAILVAGKQLVTLVRPKSRGLHPSDLILVLNFVASTTSLKESESWLPICLPRFNDTGHLHMYGHYIAPDICVLLVSTGADKFYQLAQSCTTIVEELQSNAALETIADALAQQFYSVADIGIPGLLHFLYKSTTTRQYTSPAMEGPYARAKEQRRLFRLYQHVHAQVHTISKSVKVYYQVTHTETVLGWVTAGFELYVVFGPLVQKAVAITSCNRLLRWIKQEENSLFVLNSPVW